MPLDGAGNAGHEIAAMGNDIDSVVRVVKNHCVYLMMLTVSFMIWRYVKRQVWIKPLHKSIGIVLLGEFASDHFNFNWIKRCRKFEFTFTCGYCGVPHSRMLVARGNTRDCWRAIQTIANCTRKVTLCSIMIITTAYAQWSCWVYRQSRAVDNW